MESQEVIEQNIKFYQIRRNNVIQEAEFHAACNIIGVEEEGETQSCPCCGKTLKSGRFSLDVDVRNFARIGVGFSLYFFTIQQLTKLLAVLLLVSVIFHAGGEYLSSKVAREVYFWLLLCAVYWLRLRVRAYFVELKDEHRPDIEDFSVLVSGLPQGGAIETKHALNEMFASLNFRNGLSYDLFDVSLAYKTKELLDAEAWSETLVNQLLRIDQQLYFLNLDSSKRERLKKSREQVNSKLTICKKEIARLNEIFFSCLISDNQTELYNRKAFLTLRSQAAAADLLKRFDSSAPFLLKLFRRFQSFLGAKGLIEIKRKSDALLQPTRVSVSSILIMDDSRISIYPSDNPRNIEWRNIGVGFFRKKVLRVLVFFSSIAMLVISFFIIARLNSMKYEYLRETRDSFLDRTVYSMKFSLVIIVFNLLLTQFIYNTIFWEYHETLTRSFSSMIKKMVLKLFLNSSVTIFLICISSQKIDPQYMVFQLTTFIIISIIAYPCISWFDFWYFYGLYMKFYIKSLNHIKYSQRYINSIFQPPEYNIVIFYSTFIFFFLHATFYLSFYPLISAGGSLVFYLIYYRAQKYYFINRYSLINNFGDDLNNNVMNIIDITPLIFISGAHLYDCYSSAGYSFNGYMWFKQIFAFVFCFLPNRQICEMLFDQKTYSYPDIGNFSGLEDEYFNRFNPAYRNLKDFKELL